MLVKWKNVLLELWIVSFFHRIASDVNKSKLLKLNPKREEEQKIRIWKLIPVRFQTVDEHHKGVFWT